MGRLRILLWVACAMWMGSWGGGAARAAEEKNAPERMNVLFICVDDLRPELGAYGAAGRLTPFIDGLAREGRAFERHYVQVPTCGASRAALLTGRYPRRTGEYDNGALIERPAEEIQRQVSMPQLFRQSGYRAVAIGKVSHEPGGMRADGKGQELPGGWDEVGAPSGKWGSEWNAFFGYADGSTRTRGKSPVMEKGDVADDGYADGLIAEQAIGKLRELKDRPFFLAVGFYKPHLPFNAPRRYWDLYKEEGFTPPVNGAPPRGADPKISLHRSGEMLGQYTGFARPGTVSEAEGRALRHAYAACVSYTDAQVGKVLAELEKLGLKEKTVVVIWGDHGWHLGEQGIWGKHTLHEVALRSPLIVRVPGMKGAGEKARGIVESVDIYPTLAEVCGLEAPAGLDGKSFGGLLGDAKGEGKKEALGFWSRGRAHSIRTDRWRLTQWTVQGEPMKVAQIELYDHQADPGETENVAGKHPEVVEELRKRLLEGAPVLRERWVEKRG